MIAPALILCGIVLFIIGFIKACWLYDEYKYKQSAPEPGFHIDMLKAPPGGEVFVQIKDGKMVVRASGPGAVVKGSANGQPLPEPTVDESPIAKMIAEELEK